MPYVVINGTVRSRGHKYALGCELPSGVGDEAMVEAGAIEWREPEDLSDPEDGLGDEAMVEQEDEAEADDERTAEELLGGMTKAELLDLAAVRGIEASPRITKADLVALLMPEGGE